MFIEPKTNIRILKDVPLDNTYQHTIYFDTKEKQSEYFISKQKFALNDSSYQRVQRGKARVGVMADNMYDCNYMMFMNTNFGNKWFYAFITGVEYVNNITAEITFEIDVMQTWLFDFHVQENFIERNHVMSDGIGEHIEPEPVSLGEYVMNDYQPVYNMSEMATIVAVVNTNNNAVAGSVYDGIYGGATLYAYEFDNWEEINAKLAEYIQKPDSIVGIYQVPRFLINKSLGDPVGGTNHLIPMYTEPVRVQTTGKAITTNSTLDGYKPRNNKLYTYPYNFCHVDNGNGSSLCLRYEFFSGLTPYFYITGTLTQPCQVVLKIKDYKGSGNETLNTEQLTLSGYPLCSWNYDAYQAWTAQNAFPIAMKGITDIGNMGISIASGGFDLGKTASNVLGNVTSTLTQAYKSSIASDVIRGNFSNGGPNVADGKQQFYYGSCSINNKSAIMIDNFFDMFGYAIKTKGYPNLHGRTHWNYVKLIGTVLTGSVPADDMKKICDIFDTGITFWNNGNEVGDYNLDNTL